MDHVASYNVWHCAGVTGGVGGSDGAIEGAALGMERVG